MATLKLRRLGYALGAEITGLDLSRPLDDATFEAIRQAWWDHGVLCVREQQLTPYEQVDFCSRFGPLDDHHSRPRTRHPDHIAVQLIVNRPVVVNGKAMKPSTAAQWHSDLGYSTEPAAGTFLHALDLPDVGGETMFANIALAYETLSPALQRILDGLEGVYDLGFYQRGNDGLRQEDPQQQAERLATYPPVVHPLVRAHPQTRRKALHVGAFLRGIAGMTDEESRALIDYLDSHAVRYEFVYRHAWRPGDLLMWDNRCVLHYAIPNFDNSQLRRMQRCVAPGPQSGRLERVSA
jgi:taurine dioxygenase